MRSTSTLFLVLALGACGDDGAAPARPDAAPEPPQDPTLAAATRMSEEGRETFRHDSFGDEAFWGGTLRLHEAVATLSPTAALGLGLKVDATRVPPGDHDLEDPAVTLALLRADAVVGVKGFFDGDQLSSIGITCALCHSTVDDS